MRFYEPVVGTDAPGTTTVFTARAAPSGNAAPPLQRPRQWLSLPTGPCPSQSHIARSCTACGPLNAFLPRLLCLFSQHLSDPASSGSFSGARAGRTGPGTPGSDPIVSQAHGQAALGVRLPQAVQSLCPRREAACPAGNWLGWSPGAGSCCNCLWLEKLVRKTPNRLPGHRAVPHSAGRMQSGADLGAWVL